MNQPLQKRAGQNIGVSPLGGVSIYQQHVDAPYILVSDTDTVLWESQPRCVRAPGGSKAFFPGALLTTAVGSPDDIEGDIIFVDPRGVEFLIGEAMLTMADGAGLLVLDGDVASGKSNGLFGTGLFGLCDDEGGEKIILRMTGDAPAGRVQAVPASKDLKVKGQGKGGLSDGGVVCLRGEITSQGVDFGPPPGQTWELGNDAVAGLVAGGLNLYIANASVAPLAANDIASVRVSFIGPDGTAYLIGATAPTFGDPLAVPRGLLEFQNTNPFNSNPVLKGIIQYPSKIRLSLDSSSVVNGRVEAMLLAVQNDVAPDLSMENA